MKVKIKLICDALKVKKKPPLFPVALPTLIFWCRPKTFLGIFRRALLKSGSLFYIDYVKKIPYRPTLFLFDMQQETQVFFLWPNYS